MTGPYSTVSAASGQGGLECVGVIKMAGDESSGGLSLTRGSKAGLPWDCQPEPLVACVWGGTSHSMGVSEREYLRGNVRRARDQGASCGATPPGKAYCITSAALYWLTLSRTHLGLTEGTVLKLSLYS